MAKGLATAYYNLSTLLDAGVPILRSLRAVTAGLKGPLHRAFAQLTEAVSKGDPLTEAMGTNPKVFARLDTMIIHAAETSGNQAEAFALLAQWYEFSKRIKRRILSGLALPILLIHLTALIAPFPALALSGWDVRTYLLSALRIVSLFYIPTAIVVAIIRLTPQAGVARRTLDHISLKIPVLGKALYRLALSRYCRVFHMLCKAGLPITQCAEMAVSSTGNAVVADLLRPAAAGVKAGNMFSEGLSNKLPPEFVEPWRIADETGALDDIAKRLADTNAEAAEFWFAEFARWLPRAAYAFVALVMIYQIFRLLSVIASGMPGLP